MSLRRFVVCLLLALRRALGGLRRRGQDHRRQHRGGRASRDEPAVARQSVQCRDLHALHFSAIERNAPGRDGVHEPGDQRRGRRRRALDVQKRVEQIVAAADAQGVKLYWLGPPCVLKPWETYSKKLDEILAAQLAGTSVTYVSLQDPGFCERSLHAAGRRALYYGGLRPHVAESGLGRGSSRSSSPPRANTRQSPTSARRRPARRGHKKKMRGRRAGDADHAPRRSEDDRQPRALEAWGRRAFCTSTVCFALAMVFAGAPTRSPPRRRAIRRRSASLLSAIRWRTGCGGRCSAALEKTNVWRKRSN